MIESGEFVEHLEVSGNLYGTTAAAIRDVIDGQDKICIMDTNIKSVMKVNFTCGVKPPRAAGQ